MCWRGGVFFFSSLHATNLTTMLAVILTNPLHHCQHIPFWIYYHKNYDYAVCFSVENCNQDKSDFCRAQLFLEHTKCPTRLRVIDSRFSCPEWRSTALKKVMEFMQRQECQESTEQLEMKFCLQCSSLRLWKNHVLSPCKPLC